MKLSSTSVVLAVVLLTGCAGVSEPEPEIAEPEPEITLNLPRTDCQCEQETQDYTFLEKGFVALEEGEYLESLQYFQRFQRIEKTPLADAEARIAIAYLSILPDSPIYDREAARESYRRTRGTMAPDLPLHREILLMQASLETFLDMQGQMDRLRQSNTALHVELEKREAALKRLRDLTLGRQPADTGN